MEETRFYTTRYKEIIEFGQTGTNNFCAIYLSDSWLTDKYKNSLKDEGVLSIVDGVNFYIPHGANKNFIDGVHGVIAAFASDIKAGRFARS